MTALNCLRCFGYLALLCSTACTGSGQGDGASGGTNWLRCILDVDCSQHPDAVRCSDDGYCEDATGARVETPNPSTSGDGGMSTASCDASVEICNGVDDDCDGDADESAAADLSCESRLVNTITFCDEYKGLCVIVACISAEFLECDGEPSNGCEPAEECLPDGGPGGADDAGE